MPKFAIGLQEGQVIFSKYDDSGEGIEQQLMFPLLNKEQVPDVNFYPCYTAGGDCLEAKLIECLLCYVRQVVDAECTDQEAFERGSPQLIENTLTERGAHDFNVTFRQLHNMAQLFRKWLQKIATLVNEDLQLSCRRIESRQQLDAMVAREKLDGVICLPHREEGAVGGCGKRTLGDDQSIVNLQQDWQELYRCLKVLLANKETGAWILSPRLTAYPAVEKMGQLIGELNLLVDMTGGGSSDESKASSRRSSLLGLGYSALMFGLAKTGLKSPPRLYSLVEKMISNLKEMLNVSEKINVARLDQLVGDNERVIWSVRDQRDAQVALLLPHFYSGRRRGWKTACTVSVQLPVQADIDMLLSACEQSKRQKIERMCSYVLAGKNDGGPGVSNFCFLVQRQLIGSWISKAVEKVKRQDSAVSKNDIQNFCEVVCSEGMKKYLGDVGRDTFIKEVTQWFPKAMQKLSPSKESEEAKNEVALPAVMVM